MHIKEWFYNVHPQNIIGVALNLPEKSIFIVTILRFFSPSDENEFH